MKKVLNMVLASSFVLFAMSCDNEDEKVISESKLPQAAHDFIETHFVDQSITRAVKDSEGSVSYDVRLSNGFELEFNKSGVWKEVDGNGATLPESIVDVLPTEIITYVEANHESQAVTKIDIRKSNYEVELTGGTEIVFSTTGEFLRYED